MNNRKNMKDGFHDPLTPEQRVQYDEARKKLREKLKPHFRAIKECERLTAADLKLRINY